MSGSLKVSVAVKWIALLVLLLLRVTSFSQSADTIDFSTDSLAAATDSLLTGIPAQDSSLSDSMRTTTSATSDFLSPNFLTKVNEIPVSATITARRHSGNELFFYSIFFIALLLALLKIIFDKYFNNLFRVFFNTSLRQSQLKDQLLQSAFPSLAFNIFFFISGGYYLYLLLDHYERLDIVGRLWAPFICIAALAVIYSFKFAWLGFTGWVTGAGREMKAYVFNVFLTNKIIGIMLLAFLPLIAFSAKEVAAISITISAMLILVMLVLRFFRSYGLVADYFKLGRFHFLLYIISLEILPLLLLYRLGLMILDKNL